MFRINDVLVVPPSDVLRESTERGKWKPTETGVLLK